MRIRLCCARHPSPCLRPQLGWHLGNLSWQQSISALCTVCASRWGSAPTRRRRPSTHRTFRTSSRAHRWRCRATSTRTTWPRTHGTCAWPSTRRAAAPRRSRSPHSCRSPTAASSCAAAPALGLGQLPSGSPSHMSASTTHACTNASGDWQLCFRKRGTRKGSTRS